MAKEEVPDGPPEILKARVEDLMVNASETKVVKLQTLGRSVTIKMLSAGDLRDIARNAKDDAMQHTINIVLRGMVEPKMTLPQVEGLKGTVLFELAGQINRFSGLDEESLRKARFLPEQEKEGPSGQ